MANFSRSDIVIICGVALTSLTGQWIPALLCLVGFVGYWCYVSYRNYAAIMRRNREWERSRKPIKVGLWLTSPHYPR